MPQDQLRRKILEAAERRRQDNERCAVAEALTQSIEVLGIDDSDDDEGQEGKTQIIAVVDLVDCTSPADLPVLLATQAAAAAKGSAVVIDLLEDEEQETKMEGDDDALGHFHRTTRKRKLNDAAAAETIDLTADD